MKYLVKRVRNVLEAIVLEANSEGEAIETARKTMKKDWKNLDDKRRKNYTAEKVSTKSE